MSVRILYLDDDAAFVRLVQKSLGRLGHHVLHAEDLESALRHLQDQEFDAIVLDHYLPNMTGHHVLDRLRASGIILPVVYVTGSNEAKIAIDALKAGASDYVIKTIGDDFLPLLTGAIEQSVENARLRAEKIRADEEIRLAKDHAEALLGEVNHRVANSLALVGSLLRLQMANTKSEEAKIELSHTQARIAAIAGMHRSLYTADDVRRVEMDRYLGTLMEQIASSVQRTENQISVSFQAEPIVMTSDRAVSVGMVLTELVTNAFKYAYPLTESGEIRVALTRTGENHAVLRVEDDGVGFTKGQAPTGTGLGSRIVKSMSANLGSGIRYLDVPRGTVVEVPLEIQLQDGAD